MKTQNIVLEFTNKNNQDERMIRSEIFKKQQEGYKVTRTVAKYKGDIKVFMSNV